LEEVEGLGREEWISRKLGEESKGCLYSGSQRGGGFAAAALTLQVLGAMAIWHTLCLAVIVYFRNVMNLRSWSYFVQQSGSGVPYEEERHKEACVFGPGQRFKLPGKGWGWNN
jgi:hypothetical protein